MFPNTHEGGRIGADIPLLSIGQSPEIKPLVGLDDDVAAEWPELHPAGDQVEHGGIALDIKIIRRRTEYDQRWRRLGQDVALGPQKRIAENNIQPLCDAELAS